AVHADPGDGLGGRVDDEDVTSVVRIPRDKVGAGRFEGYEAAVGADVGIVLRPLPAVAERQLAGGAGLEVPEEDLRLQEAVADGHRVARPDEGHEPAVGADIAVYAVPGRLDAPVRQPLDADPGGGP